MQLIIETDASNHGLRVMLLQDKHPIAFFSKAFGTRASLKSIYKKEMMAIVFAVLKCKHYLLGRRSIVKTNHKSLKYLLEQREVTSEYQKWVVTLMGFEFTIEYNPSRNNTVADALSRIPHTVMKLGHY